MRASHDLVDCMRCTHERLKRLEQYFVVAIQRDDTDAKRSNATIVDATTEWEREKAVERIEKGGSDTDLLPSLTTLNDAWDSVSFPSQDDMTAVEVVGEDKEELERFQTLVQTVCARHELNPNDWVNAWKYLASRILVPCSTKCFQAGIIWISKFSLYPDEEWMC